MSFGKRFACALPQRCHSTWQRALEPKGAEPLDPVDVRHSRLEAVRLPAAACRRGRWHSCSIGNGGCDMCCSPPLLHFVPAVMSLYQSYMKGVVSEII